jgi:hypothetical protein
MCGMALPSANEAIPTFSTTSERVDHTTSDWLSEGNHDHKG